MKTAVLSRLWLGLRKYTCWLLLVAIVFLILQSIAAMIWNNRQQKVLLYPNAKEQEGWEWSEWHINIVGSKYFNIYFSDIRALYITYSIKIAYVSPNTLAEIQEWYTQEKGCKEIKSTINEWKGYCSKDTLLPPEKTFIVFPYQEIYISNNGFPNNGGALITVTTDLSVGIQALLSPTDFSIRNNQKP